MKLSNYNQEAIKTFVNYSTSEEIISLLLPLKIKPTSIESNSFSTFTIPKRNGKVRSITAPGTVASIIYKFAQLLFEKYYEKIASESTLAFRPGSSVIDGVNEIYKSAKFYNKGCILKIDMKKYFDSISKGLVFSILYNENLLQLKDNKALYIYSLLNKLYDITKKRKIYNDQTQNTKTIQGFHYSPVISNIVGHYIIDPAFKTAIRKYIKVKYNKNVDLETINYKKYFRYADDIICILPYTISEQTDIENGNKTKLKEDVNLLLDSINSEITKNIKDYINTTNTLIKENESHIIKNFINENNISIKRIKINRQKVTIRRTSKVIENKYRGLKILGLGIHAGRVTVSNNYITKAIKYRIHKELRSTNTLSNVTQGKIAHIKANDKVAYRKLLEYIEKQKEFARQKRIEDKIDNAKTLFNNLP